MVGRQKVERQNRRMRRRQVGSRRYLLTSKWADDELGSLLGSASNRLRDSTSIPGVIHTYTRSLRRRGLVIGRHKPVAHLRGSGASAAGDWQQQSNVGLGGFQRLHLLITQQLSANYFVGGMVGIACTP